MKTKLKLDPSNPGAVREALKDFFGETEAFFGSMASSDAVPEAFRSQFDSLKQGVNATLRQLSSVPTDQVPAAMQASYALDHMAFCITSLREMYEGAVTRLKGMIDDLSPKAQLAQQLNGRIEKGELLADEPLQKRINAEVDQALQEERARLTLLGQRRQLLASANLPVPADDKVLEGDEKAFEGCKTTATNRLKKLGEAGIDCQQLNGAHLASLAYGPEDGFSTLLGMHQAARGGKPGKTPAEPAEPLAGGEKTDTGKVLMM